ncbi:MAG: metallophosphoesterase [Clostridiaceae bacterium]
MKLAFISDLHLDLNKKYPVLDMVVETAEEKKADVLVIAGDLSNDCDLTLKYVDELKSKFSGDVYFVAGKHDMFNIDGKYDSTYYIYDKYMQHENSLMNKDVVLNEDWVLLGDMFWYDYSFGDRDKYTDEEFRIQFHEGMAWADYKYIDWQNDDISISDILVDRMEKRIQKYPDKNIIVVSHMVMNRDFVGYERYPNTDYFAAFVGSEKIGQLMEKYGVKIAVMGHVHLRRESYSENTHYICPCLNYYFEWDEKDGDTARKQIENTMKFVEI